jgi:hypothetical protein
VVGALLPLAFVVAVSPLPILAVILMFLTPRAGVTSAGFIVGWIVGSAAVTTVSSLLAGTSSPSSTAASWVPEVGELVPPPFVDVRAGLWVSLSGRSSAQARASHARLSAGPGWSPGCAAVHSRS